MDRISVRVQNLAIISLPLVERWQLVKKIALAFNRPPAPTPNSNILTTTSMKQRSSTALVEPSS